MRRYHFIFSDQAGDAGGDEGLDYEDDAAALAAAEEGARETLIERLRAGKPFGHETISVTDDNGRQLFVVSFDDIIARSLENGERR